MPKYRVSKNISKAKFKTMVAGKKGYIDSKTAKALREAGKSKVLSKASVRPDEAKDIMKFLLEKKLLYGSAGKAGILVDRAKKEQGEEEEKEQIEQEEEKMKEEKKKEEAAQKRKEVAERRTAAKAERIAKREAEVEAKTKQHIAGRIKMDIAEEQMKEETEEGAQFSSGSILNPQHQQAGRSEGNRAGSDSTETRVDVNKLAHGDREQQIPSKEDINNLPELPI